MASRPLNILTIKNKVQNFPLSECRKAGSQLIDDGWEIRQKWTCEKCGSREIQQTPNIFFPFGECKCGHATDIEASGCNYQMAKPL